MMEKQHKLRLCDVATDRLSLRLAFALGPGTLFLGWLLCRYCMDQLASWSCSSSILYHTLPADYGRGGFSYHDGALTSGVPNDMTPTYLSLYPSRSLSHTQTRTHTLTLSLHSLTCDRRTKVRRTGALDVDTSHWQVQRREASRAAGRLSFSQPKQISTRRPESRSSLLPDLTHENTYYHISLTWPRPPTAGAWPARRRQIC